MSKESGSADFDTSINSSKVDASSILSVDVEDWFHILESAAAPNFATWNSQPSLVERNFRALLDIFSEFGASVTCFFLGWVVERFPWLVREARARGHEIASHGYSHTLCYEMTPDEFLADILRAKNVTEGASGERVLGYRAPGFSATEKTPWFFEKLAEAGFIYDSSIFPAPRQHGGLPNSPLAPYSVETPMGAIMEFPVTVTKVLGRPLCFFGGGYLRLFPYAAIRGMTRRVLREERPVIFYVHPREIDPHHPRLRMNPARRLKSYIGLSTTRGKLRSLLSDFSVTTFEDYLSRNSSR
jgi:polysaccharide deacetylase family protein (PEP-CTERM system associated)